MRQLLPHHVADVGHDLLVAAYRYPERRRVRANMVSSLDGSVTVGGRAGALGSAGDAVVFDLLRGLADVVLVGAGTARVEGYRGLRPKPAYADLRRAEGQSPAPMLAVVSSRLDLDPGSTLFHGEVGTVVVTHAAADRAARDRLAEVADVLVAGTAQVDLAAALDALAERGLTRVLCEGGPLLLGALAAADRLDELCLTLSPRLVGGAGPRLLSAPALDVGLALAHLFEDDGVLLSRWAAR